MLRTSSNNAIITHITELVEEDKIEKFANDIKYIYSIINNKICTALLQDYKYIVDVFLFVYRKSGKMAENQ